MITIPARQSTTRPGVPPRTPPRCRPESHQLRNLQGCYTPNAKSLTLAE
jgi:hypothetical protein